MNCIQTYALARAAILSRTNSVSFAAAAVLLFSLKCPHTRHKNVLEILTPVGWSRMTFFLPVAIVNRSIGAPLMMAIYSHHARD